MILQISENAVRFHGGQLEPIAAATAAVARQADVPIALHLDHVTDDELVTGRNGIRLQLSDVRRGSAAVRATTSNGPESSLRRRTRLGSGSEAELGYVGGKADAPQSAHRPGVRTDPDEAAAFVAATGVDALAVAVGSSHAMTEQTARLDIDPGSEAS